MSLKLYYLIRCVCILTLFSTLVFCGFYPPPKGQIVVMAFCVAGEYFVGSY